MSLSPGELEAAEGAQWPVEPMELGKYSNEEYSEAGREGKWRPHR